MTSINPSEFNISQITKGKSGNDKLITLTGTVKGHKLTLVITLDRKNKRDDIIKKIKTQGLTITQQSGSNQLQASIGDPGKSIPFKVQVTSHEASFQAGQIVGSKLLLTQQVSKKVAEKHFSNHKSGYISLMDSYEPSPTPDLEKGKTSGSGDIPISRPLKPPTAQKPGPDLEKGKITANADIPVSHQLKPLPTRPPPRSAASMAGEIMTCPYFRAELDPMKAAKALTEPRHVPGTVIVTNSFNPQFYPFVASVKLPDGTVSQNLISIEKTAYNAVYRVSDENALEVKVGAGTGYSNIVDCLTALSRHELARVPPKPPPFNAIEQEMVTYRAELQGRAGKLFQDLQGLKAPLQEMGYKPHEVDSVLTNLCFNIAEFERSGQKNCRIRKNAAAFHLLGLPLPFSCFLDTKYGNQGVLVYLTTPGVVQGAVVGQGTYKVVKTNYEINIPPAGSPQKPLIKAHDMVLVRAKKGVEQEVIKGADLLKQLRQEIGPDVIPAIFSERRYLSKKGKERYEYNQTRFQGDFDKVIREGRLPLQNASAASQTGQAGMMKFAFADKIKALIEVTDKIHRFHLAGYVHRDVKPPNMLIQFVSSPSGEAPRAVAFPADYDLTRKAGFEETSAQGKAYAFWDPCAREGIITPNCDVFGLTYSLGMALFPNFYDHVKSRTRLEAHTDFAALMENKVTRKMQELGIADSPSMQELRTKMGAPRTFRSYCQMVHDTFQQFSLLENLTFEKSQEIRQFQAELAILPDLWRLIGRIFNSSDELLRDVHARNDLMQKLRSPNPYEARVAAQEVTRMAALKGLPTAEGLREYLKSMQRITLSSAIV